MSVTTCELNADKQGENMSKQLLVLLCCVYRGGTGSEEEKRTGWGRGGRWGL